MLVYLVISIFFLNANLSAMHGIYIKKEEKY